MGDDEPERKTSIDMTMQQTADKGDALLDSTFAGIEPAVAWAHGINTDGDCGSQTRRRSVTTVIAPGRKGEFLEVVEKRWRALGYRITKVHKDTKLPAVYATAPGEFRLGMSFGYQDQAHFQVATPCAEKSDVEPPPRYTGEKPPLPSGSSGHWSS